MAAARNYHHGNLEVFLKAARDWKPVSADISAQMRRTSGRQPYAPKNHFGNMASITMFTTGYAELAMMMTADAIQTLIASGGETRRF